jgi:hypothetical protein
MPVAQHPAQVGCVLAANEIAINDIAVHAMVLINQQVVLARPVQLQALRWRHQLRQFGGGSAVAGRDTAQSATLAVIFMLAQACAGLQVLIQQANVDLHSQRHPLVRRVSNSAG